MGIGLIGQLVAGAILALLVFLYWRKGEERAKKLKLWKGVYVPCSNPACIVQAPGQPSHVTDMMITGTYKSGKLRGELFECASCGQETWFDMDRRPPVVTRVGRRREPKKPKDPKQPRETWKQRRDRRRKEGGK